jgi:hypothetical protein
MYAPLAEHAKEAVNFRMMDFFNSDPNRAKKVTIFMSFLFTIFNLILY